MRRLRLGLNIDHVATVRNSRGGISPDPLRAAHLAAETGFVDGITAHLREDRRHISDDDIARLRAEISLPLNLEMAATEEMRTIALLYRPHAVCLVPERREERTTEGGLNLVDQLSALRDYIAPISEAGIRVSLFIEPDPIQIESAKNIGTPVVELHTGKYCNSQGSDRLHELSVLKEAARFAHSLGIEVHAGHGLDYDTVEAVAAISELTELNIGHFLIGEAIFCGLKKSLQKMRQLMDAACGQGESK